MTGSLFTAALLLSSAAFATPSEAEAEACVRQKVWDGYSDGWSIRTLATSTLKLGGTEHYLVTFYEGNDYQIITCSDKNTVDLDILLYDTNGMLVSRDTNHTGEPKLSFTPEKTTAYYVVAYSRELKAGATATSVAVAVTYR